MRRIAVINQKGGVGKTTSCCNIGAAIASTGRRVLMIDLDPQAHLSMHLGIDPYPDRPSVYDVLTDGLPLADAAITLSKNLQLIPAHIDLAAAEMELVSVMGREVILRDALPGFSEQFDVLMMDCPPSLGVLTINGLAAANEVLIPLQPHFLALQGVGKLLETIELVQKRINPELVVSGIILCMYEAGTRLAAEVTSDLKEFVEAARDMRKPWSKAKVFSTVIRRNIKLAESPGYGKTIFDYAHSSNGATDYAALAAEVLGIDHLEVPTQVLTSSETTEISNQGPADKQVSAESGALDSPPERQGESISAECTMPAELVAPPPARDAVNPGLPDLPPLEVEGRVVTGPHELKSSELNNHDAPESPDAQLKEVNPSQVNPSQVKPSQVKPSQVNPSETSNSKREPSTNPRSPDSGGRIPIQFEEIVESDSEARIG
jgi:chromosome partitioning protein